MFWSNFMTTPQIKIKKSKRRAGETFKYLEKCDEVVAVGQNAGAG
jgi:hypothetical protein